MGPVAYAGYLAPHLDLIIEGHKRGFPIRRIAELLYAAGARAQTSDARPRVLSREQHVANLQAMVAYVLVRLGLRTRRSRRHLTARRCVAADGSVVWDTS